MTMTHKTKVLIIGSGPAGYTAAIYAARADLKPIVVAGLQPGGQLTITTEIENFPGFVDPIGGIDLMDRMKEQATKVGAEVVYDIITEVDLKSNPKKAKGSNGDTYLADTVIICTGAEAKWMDITGEEEFKSKGVSACALCDGPFYRNKEVAVIGGGNSAVEEAMFLTNFASKVTLIHRRDELRAEKILQDRLHKNGKVEIMWDTTLEEILGDDKGVTGLFLKNVKTNETTKIDVHGVFIAIGHIPATALFHGQLDMDDEGYLLTKPDSTATNIEGVYAAGDVRDKTYRQAVTAAGMGCMAATEAEKYL